MDPKACEGNAVLRRPRGLGFDGRYCQLLVGMPDRRVRLSARQGDCVRRSCPAGRVEHQAGPHKAWDKLGDRVIALCGDLCISAMRTCDQTIRMP